MMVARRRTPSKEKTEIPWKRNLTNDQLGAVVFGCKNHTIAECFHNKIFGLPAAHYSYVKNIAPGLPLYLFNYSDRKLHGIFEAVSTGQMNISPYAWIGCEGSEETPYPAQVLVCEKRRCLPLIEHEFKRVIGSNYYAERLFWFELDKEQNGRLMKLFLPSPERMLPHVLSSSNATEALNDEIRNLDMEDCSAKAGGMRLQKSDHVGGRDVFVAKKWAELFKPSCAKKNWMVLGSQKVRSHSSMSDMELKYALSAKGKNMMALHDSGDASSDSRCCKDSAS